jgi:hypothetical protein
MTDDGTHLDVVGTTGGKATVETSQKSRSRLPEASGPMASLTEQLEELREALARVEQLIRVQTIELRALRDEQHQIRAADRASICDLQKRAEEAELEADLLRHERDYEEPYGQ